MVQQRVVSLIASATEIVCALGCEDRLVGRSHECDFPPSVKRLPVCTTPKFADGTSYEIDERVKAILQEGLSVYRVDGAKLRDLRPDVIVTQSHCEVCAVSERDVEEAVCTWLDSRPLIVSLAPNQLNDVWAGFQQAAEALQVAAHGQALVARLEEHMEQIANNASNLPRPTVAYIEWIDPLMAGGNWMPELIAMAGGVNLFGEAGKHSPWMTWEELRRADPEVIFIAPCGFDIARTRQEMPALVSKPGWNELRAVRDRRVYLADGNQYFNRPGPRLVESLEILAEVLHPSQSLRPLSGRGRGEGFHFGHEGTGWQWL
jgi:iron complex transport system substrate-binding protein